MFSVRFHRKFSKRSNRWTISKVKKRKGYEYLNDITSEKRLIDGKPVTRKLELPPEDPRRIASIIAPMAPEKTSKIAADHKCRGLRK